MTIPDILAKCHKTLALAEKATPGPWKSLGYGFGTKVSPGDIGFCHGFQDDCEGPEIDRGPHSAAFIAHSRTFTPAAALALKSNIEKWQRLKIAYAETDTAWIIADEALQSILNSFTHEQH